MTELTENTFWISGIINGEYRECDGPYTTPKDMTDKGYPYVTKAPNPNFTHQKYDYTAHEWVDTSKDALIRDVEDLKKVTDNLQENQTKTDKASQIQDAKSDKMMGLLNLVVKEVGSISAKLNTQPTTTPTTTNTSTETKEEGAN